MRATLPPIPSASDALPTQPCQALNHLPGPKGHWFSGNVGGLLPDLGPFVRDQQQRYGNVFTIGLFRNKRAVMLVGPRANEQILLDKHNNFSSRLGWEVLLELFGRNVLVRDFADHRQHRRLMTHIFKPGALARYLEQMNPIIARGIDAQEGGIDVYRCTKQLALDIAIEVFAGIPAGPDSAQWNQDLTQVLNNAMAQRIRFPGTPYWRGLRARDRLKIQLREQIAERRSSKGEDLFSQLASQADEDGIMLSDDDVIDHMFGMLFAAHDTTASSLAMISWLLARHPDWQAALRDECVALHARTGSNTLAYADLDQLPKVDWVFKEALRLYSPLQLIPRRSVEAFEFEGHLIPANTAIYLVPQAVHFDPQYFAEPEQFDPNRFAPAEHQSTTTKDDAFAFIPFGKGAHMCLGMHFAYMEIKAVVYQLLLTRELQLQDQTPLELDYLPIVRPKKPMMIDFTAITR